MLPFIACYDSRDIKEDIKQEITSFSNYYFNYEYKNAIDYVTPDSRKWIIYVASNLSDDDIEALNTKTAPAVTEITDLTYNAYDSTGIVVVAVKNNMAFDSIGVTGHIADEQIYRIPFVRYENRWKIKMEAPLRNEKSDRD